MGIAMIMNFQAMRHNFFAMLIITIIGASLTYSGLIFLWIGIIFTMPFWAAMIFSLYQQIFDNEELKNNN